MKNKPIDWAAMSEKFRVDGPYLIRKTDTKYKKAGSIVGSVCRQEGYRRMKFKKKTYMVHRVIYAICHQTDLVGQDLDHINGIRSDNRIENLRLCDTLNNSRNRKRSKLNTSGQTGIVWRKKQRIWEARIVVKRRQIHLGVYKDFKDALAARKKAEKEHGFHKNHGRVAKTNYTK